MSDSSAIRPPLPSFRDWLDYKTRYWEKAAKEASGAPRTAAVAQVRRYMRALEAARRGFRVA